MELACGVTAQVVRLKGDGWGGKQSCNVGHSVRDLRGLILMYSVYLVCVRVVSL